jgi:hypothetical protein
VYETALTALVAMNHFASAQHVGQAKNEDLTAVLGHIDEALARLMLEPGAKPIAQQFEQLIRAFTGLRIMQAQKMDPDIRLTDVFTRQDDFRQKATAFQEAIHASLEPLDQPLPTAQTRLPSMHKRPWWAVWRRAGV